MKTLAVCVLVLVTVCHALKLPDAFKKCNKSRTYFNDCLSYAIPNAIRKLHRPFLEYGLPRLEPFEIPRSFETGNVDSGVRQIYSNVTVHGLTKVTNADARYDTVNNILHLKLTFPEIRFESDFHISGNIIILPVNSYGSTSTICKNPIFFISFYLQEYKKENKVFYNVIKTDLDVQTERVFVSFKSVFEKEHLNNAFNEELNRKWENVFGYMMKTYVTDFEYFYGSLFNNFLEKVPKNELFDE